MADARSLYGSQILALSEVIDELMIAQGNDKRNHYFAYLTHAKWVWKDLLRKTIWSITQKLVDVPDNKIITLPVGIDRLIGISVTDHHNNLQVILQNPNINTLKAVCAPKKCSCLSCNGNDSLCAFIDEISMRTETVHIGGFPFTKRIFNQKDERGNLIEIIETPVYDADVSTSNHVRYLTTKRIICELEVDKLCCIKPTERNRTLIFEHCGNYLKSCEGLNYHSIKEDKVDLVPYSSDYGYWNWEANSKGKIYLSGSRAKQVIISYQTNGDCELGELMVPEYALDTVLLGIAHRQAVYAPTAVISLSEKQYRQSQFLTSKTKLEQYLNPIDANEFMRLQETPPRM